MSTKNKKSTMAQALLEMDAITNAIKEESKKSLNSLLSEAVINALREGCEEEKDYEVEDENDAIDTEIDSNVEAQETEESENIKDETDDEIDQKASEEDDGDEDWDEFEKYRVSDNTYDLTGENDYESVVKVYKRLKDDDHVIIRQDNNGIIHLEDEEVGTEYVIDLGNDDTDVDESKENFDSLQEGILEPDDPDFWPTSIPRDIYSNSKWSQKDEEINDIAGFEGDEVEDMENDEVVFTPKNHKYTSDKEIEDILASEWEEEEDENLPMYESIKNKIKENKTRKPMKGNKEVLFEVDLGYTDNYQDKDPIAGLSNNEPSKNGKSWHKGVPVGTEKPWAGETKSKSEPFEKTVNEEEMPDMGIEEPVEEATNVGGAVQQRSNSKSHIPNNRKEHGPKNKRHISAGAEYNEVVAENKKLKEENKELKEAIISFRKHLTEAYVTNANLGKITKLFLENTTSKSEKIDIVNRFSNEAKTIEQSKALYESIKRELNKSVSIQKPINEAMSNAKNSNIINEEKVYKSNDVLHSIDLMNRMKNY